MSDAGQLGLFDEDGGARAREAAVEKVDEHAEPDWKIAAFQAVQDTARAKPDGFIVDDVWKRIPADVEPPHEGRAMGAVILRAVRAGVIVGTERFDRSARVTSHRVPRQIWRAAP